MNFTELLAGLKRQPAPPKERRKHDRTPAHERAVVCWRDHLGLPKAHSITIVNVSTGGVAFASPEHLDVGQVISITTSNRSLDCAVRHVRATPRGFYLGAEILSAPEDDGQTAALRKIAGVGSTPPSE